MLESKMHESNSFVTFTYSDEYLPPDGSLNYRHFQLFLKRLRAKLWKAKRPPFRFFVVGEYGDSFGRPHFHALLFGYWPPDAEPANGMRSRHPLWKSAELSSCWGQGYVSVGAVTPETARYCAAYVLKRFTGPGAAEHYERVHPVTGEIIQLTPEFARMSLRPGIGATWFEKYHPEVYVHDGVHLADKKVRIPKYFDKLGDLVAPMDSECSKVRRQEVAQVHYLDNTRERLQVREQVAHAAQKFNRERYGK